MGSGRTDAGQDINSFSAPDLSPTDLAEHTAQMLASVMESTGLLEVVEVKANAATEIHIMCRVKKTDEKRVMQDVVDPILDVEESSPVSVWLGKQFFRKKKKDPKTGVFTKKTVYGWVFAFNSEDIRSMAHKICEAIDEVIPKMEVVEAPLMGPSTPPGSLMTRGGGTKGASPIRG